MTWKELLASVAARTGMEKEDAAKHVGAVLEVISEGLAGGEKVSLLNFGNFLLMERAARVMRNPQSGKPLKVPAKKTVKFKVSKRLKEALNK